MMARLNDDGTLITLPCGSKSPIYQAKNDLLHRKGRKTMFTLMDNRNASKDEKPKKCVTKDTDI